MILFFFQIKKLYVAFINYFQLLKNCIKVNNKICAYFNTFLNLNLPTEIS